jgi:hypothetical protein
MLDFREVVIDPHEEAPATRRVDEEPPADDPGLKYP